MHLRGQSVAFSTVPDTTGGLGGIDRAAVLVEGSEVARSLHGFEVVHVSLVGFGARDGGRERARSIPRSRRRPSRPNTPKPQPRRWSRP